MKTGLEMFLFLMLYNIYLHNKPSLRWVNILSIRKKKNIILTLYISNK
jgi:hypothetical protein